MKPKKSDAPKRNRAVKKKNSNGKRKHEYRGITFDYDAMQFFGTGQPATQSIIERFADDQLKYFCDNPDAYFLEKYRVIRGVPHSTYHRWLESNEYLQQKHNLLLQIIAVRRKERIKDHDPKFLTNTLYTYDSRHDAAERRKAKLRDTENESKSQPIKIVFDDYREKK